MQVTAGLATDHGSYDIDRLQRISYKLQQLGELGLEGEDGHSCAGSGYCTRPNEVRQAQPHAQIADGWHTALKVVVSALTRHTHTHTPHNFKAQV